MTIGTDVGPATVLHRLALAVECVDATTDRPILTPVRVGIAVSQGHLRGDPSWPCRDLEPAGQGRFKLRYPRPHPLSVPPAGGPGPLVDRGGLPEPLAVRVDDPARRVVPRRFTVHPWSLPELDDDAGAPYVPTGARTLRVWLLPGSAAQLPSGATVVRGRVAHAGMPVRWARVRARVPGLGTAGFAHADDRGEFRLVLRTTFQNPLRSRVTLRLTVTAARQSRAAATDRLADLVTENVPRSPLPVLDSALLRGTALPPEYVASTTATAGVVVRTGVEHHLDQDIDFVPQP